MSKTNILELTTASVVSETEDFIPMVDVSDTTESGDGTTKKATVRKLLKDKALPSGDIVGTSDVQTLEGKTLTAPVVNDPEIAGGSLDGATLTSPVMTDVDIAGGEIANAMLNLSVGGSAVLDESDMVSNSNSKLATQKSIKAYVDIGKNCEVVKTILSSAITAVGNVDGWKDIPNLNVSITTRGGKILLLAYANIRTSKNIARLGIADSSGTIVANSLTEATSRIPLMCMGVISVPAGSHSFKVQFRGQETTDATATINRLHSLYLVAIEL